MPNYSIIHSTASPDSSMDNKSINDVVEEYERPKSGIHEVENTYVPGSDEEKKVVRKIDLFLLPTIFLMYLLSYMDRTK